MLKNSIMHHDRGKKCQNDILKSFDRFSKNAGVNEHNSQTAQRNPKLDMYFDTLLAFSYFKRFRKYFILNHVTMPLRVRQTDIRFLFFFLPEHSAHSKKLQSITFRL